MNAAKLPSKADYFFFEKTLKQINSINEIKKYITTSNNAIFKS